MVCAAYNRENTICHDTFSGSSRPPKAAKSTAQPVISWKLPYLTKHNNYAGMPRSSKATAEKWLMDQLLYHISLALEVERATSGLGPVLNSKVSLFLSESSVFVIGTHHIEHETIRTKEELVWRLVDNFCNVLSSLNAAELDETWIVLNTVANQSCTF